MLGLILTENSFEFNGNNYLSAHGLQWARKQTNTEKFNLIKRPYQAKRMPRNVTFMSFLLLGLNRKYVDLFIEKHSKLNAMKLNALLATPCKLSQGTDKLSNVEIYNLINFLIFLVCSSEGHQGERFKNAWRAWIARCDFTLAFYIYMSAWVYNQLAGYILGHRLLTYRACYFVHQGLKSKRYYTYAWYAACFVSSSFKERGMLHIHSA